jgi:multidrug resistance efflux pump
MEYRVAQADVQLAQLAVEGTRIIAPMDGTILERRVHVGENVGPGQALAELADLSHVIAIVNLPPREVSRIAVGRRCRIRAQGLEDTYQGSVGRIGPVVDPKTGTISVYVTVDPPEKGDLPRPGLFVAVEFAPKE